MSFSDHLYQTLASDHSSGTICTRLLLNAEHPIYKGHFPEQPITPGVVQMVVLKEILEKGLKSKLSLSKVNNCKFLAVLDPRTTSDIKVEITFSELEGTVNMNAKLFCDNQTYLKLKATYQVS